MIIGEVKEGRAVLNDAATDAGVLRAVLVAFGCCSRDDAPRLADALGREGRVTLPSGHDARLVAFGTLAGAPSRHHAVISLRHVVEFLRAYVRDHWDALRAAESKDPAFGFLITLAKAEEGTP